MRNPYPACLNFRARLEVCVESERIEFLELFSNGLFSSELKRRLQLIPGYVSFHFLY